MRPAPGVIWPALLGFALIGSLHAEPTSPATVITELRPYGGTSTVFVYTTLANGQFCDQAWYSIDIGNNGGKAMYAAALAAIAAGKTVRLEIAGCGSGPSGSAPLQSIYIQK
jgi:hypothetical protein